MRDTGCGAYDGEGLGLPAPAREQRVERFHGANNRDNRAISGNGIGWQMIHECGILPVGTIDVAPAADHASASDCDSGAQTKEDVGSD